MGARQSVAQPPRQRSTQSSNADLGGLGGGSHHSNGQYSNGHHSSLGVPSTSGESSSSNRNRSSLIFQAATSSTSSSQSNPQPRPRQTRSRSVPMPPADVIRMGSSVAGTSAAGSGQQQLPSQYRFHLAARDQSSDSSGGDNDVGLAVGLERYLLLNSSTAAAGGHSTSNASTSGGAAGTSGGGGTVWLQAAPSTASSSRHYVFADIKCPVCNKVIPSDNVELHLVVCLTRPRIAYNDDVLTEDKGECVICFEEMLHGDTIARLPCLCVYHKICIDSWFKVKNSCPEHPGDD